MSVTQSVDENLQQNCIKVNVENLEFELCADPGGVIIRHKGKEVLVEFKDFERVYALRAILDQEFDYDVKDPINGRIAEVFQGYINQLLEKLKNSQEYEVCIKFKNGLCDNEYIVANKDGVFIKEVTILKKTGEVIEELKLISPLKVKKIEIIKFSGIFDVNFDEKFVKITTEDRILTGTVDEVTTLIKSKYGLEQQEKFKFLLNLEYPQTTGYYAPGVWFDGEKLSIATESLYNPPWKSISSYKLPPQISPEKKREVLKRILATVESYKDPSIVTWVLSFGVIANFAHYLRQRVGYFPHLILIGDKKTGKTTLTTINKYLYWGNNPLPPEKPKTESQLRRLLSQSTLLTPIEEWNEISSDKAEIDEMLLLLHSSAQRFVLKKITTSNPDFNGVFLSLSAVLADANFNRDIDTSSLDKIIFIEIEKTNGIDLSKAEQNHALLKQELMANYYLHDVLHAIGLELIQIASEKLKTFDFNKERSELLNNLIQVGYSSWLDLFSKYNINLTGNVQLSFNEFPLPHITTAESDDDETELEIAFSQFIHEKTKEIGTEGVPVDKSNLAKYGFYFEDGNTVVVTSDIIKEFKRWLNQKKGITLAYSKERILTKLNASVSSRSLGGKKIKVYAIQLLQLVDFPN